MGNDDAERADAEQVPKAPVRAARHPGGRSRIGASCSAAAAAARLLFPPGDGDSASFQNAMRPTWLLR